MTDHTGYDRQHVHRMITQMHQSIAELSARYDATTSDPLIDDVYDVAPYVLQSPADIYHLLKADLVPLEQEQVIVLALNNAHRVIDRRTIYQGTSNGAAVRIAELLRPVIIAGAVAMAIAHNHPSGTVTPSEADKHLTAELNSAADLLEIRLLDHVIVSGGRPEYREKRYYSFSDDGKLSPWNRKPQKIR